MERISEQARQTPVNATPMGWHDNGVIFPSVNTCLCIASVPTAGPVIGMHLGITMDDAGGDFAKADTYGAPTLPQDLLNNWLRLMELQIGVRQTKPIRVYVAGSVDVWRGNVADHYRIVTAWARETARKYAGQYIDPIQFNDRVSYTVDIYVDGNGVRFTEQGNDTVVPAR